MCEDTEKEHEIKIDSEQSICPDCYLKKNYENLSITEKALYVLIKQQEKMITDMIELSKAAGENHE